MRIVFLLFSILFFSTTLISQKYTRADSLRGALRPERTCFDVFHYHLNIEVFPRTRSISGMNTIDFHITSKTSRIQLDLFSNMVIDSILYQQENLSYTRNFNAFFVDFPEPLETGTNASVTVYYHGKPTVALNAPWDGGFTWSKDANEKEWIGVSCEGIGASLWWPNKDHLSDEPDSMHISVTVPAGLYGVSNGKLEHQENRDGKSTFHWKVTYPINNYNVTLNIGDYVHLQDTYTGSEGPFALNYYVLAGHEIIAQKHFQQVKPMLDCYEKMLGPYPFPRDGYALIETPYLGMEHQSAIAYGNKFQMGYNGYDLTYSGLGMLFDYIIIHESGHEYWGNSVSMQDVADMWIHEGFCTYSEALYIECLYGKEKGLQYANAWKNNVSNDIPIISHYDVNQEGSGDMYYKAALMLHTLRSLVADDALWLQTIRDIQQDFRYKTTNTKEIVDYINQKLGKDYTQIFDRYLRYASPPALLVRYIHTAQTVKILLQWEPVMEGFHMPVRYTVGKEWFWIEPGTDAFVTLELAAKDFKKFSLDQKSQYFILKE